MKRCPTCQSIYTDDSLRFCLQDGSQLVGASDAVNSADETWRGHLAGSNEPPPTEILDARVAPTVRVPSPAQTEVVRTRATEIGPQGSTAPPNMAAPPRSSSPVMTVVVIAVGVLLLGMAGLGLMFWLRSPGRQSERATTADNERRTAPAAPLKITATASSTRPTLAGNTYEAANALDGRLMTAWVEGVEGAGLGEWIRCDFDREVTLKRISIAPGYFKSQQIWARNNRLASAVFSFSDGTSRRFSFDDRMEEQMLEVGAVRTNWVRIEIKEVYAGTDPDTAISQLAFESEP
jgi:F5/8 type C domain